MPYIKIIFKYQDKEINLEGKNNEYMKDIFKKFGKEIEQDIDNYLFLYQENNISQNVKLEDLIKDDVNEIQILVYDDKINKENQSKYIICPFCKKICIININNFIISLECANHNNTNILIEEIESYRKTQKIDESKTNFLCNKHKEKYISYCKDCQQNLCFRCQREHTIHQNIIIFDDDIIPDDDNLKID